MALPIWIPDALRSERSPVKKTYWRCVEAQHVVSTLQLVDTLDEQRLLEDILENTKPPVPPECEGLHYLYMTPFRYGLYPNALDFDGPGQHPASTMSRKNPEPRSSKPLFTCCSSMRILQARPFQPSQVNTQRSMYPSKRKPLSISQQSHSLTPAISGPTRQTMNRASNSKKLRAQKTSSSFAMSPSATLSTNRMQPC